MVLQSTLDRRSLARKLHEPCALERGVHGDGCRVMSGRMPMNLWSRPVQAALLMLLGYVPRQQDTVIAYQQKEVRTLRETLSGSGFGPPIRSAVGAR